LTSIIDSTKVKNTFLQYILVDVDMNVQLINYEHSQYTNNCGGGGKITHLLEVALRGCQVNVDLTTDIADRHYVTFPARSLPNLISGDYDLYHGHFSLPSSLALPAVSRVKQTPYIISVMGADIYDPTRFQRLRPLLDAANKRILQDAAAVVAPSADMRDRVESKYDIDCRLIPYGIDTSKYRWRPRSIDRDVTVVSVCRLVGRKNLHNALRAVTHYRALSGRSIQYRIVGTGPMADELKRTWADREWVEFEGYVPDLNSVYADSDVFFLPSKHEAFGLVYLEALASGLPVVTSTTGGQTDIVDTGVVGQTAPPDDPGALALALKHVIEDYDTYQKQTDGYLRGRYTAEAMAKSYRDLYEEMISRGD
jgi:glycosyltransferase involved in cell wall biosynthesis